MRAGVSTATVSRAINAPAAVSPVLGARVRTAMAALAFVPDEAARSLSSRHSRLIGVLAPTLRDDGWAAAVAGLEARLAGAGYATLLALTGGDAQREAAAAAALAGRAVEAVVAIGRTPGSAALAHLRERRISLAGIDVDDIGATGTGPGGAWWRAGRTLGQFLLALGHARCLWLTGDGAPSARATALRAGLGAALAAAALPPPAEAIAGSGATRRVALAGAGRRPTALVCADDSLALTAMCQLAADGVSVPRDLSVTGCGDTPAARHAVPPLTTLRVAYEAAGAATAERVLAQLRGEPAPRGELPIKLVVRQSTGPAP